MSDYEADVSCALEHLITARITRPVEAALNSGACVSEDSIKAVALAAIDKEVERALNAVVNWWENKLNQEAEEQNRRALRNEKGAAPKKKRCGMVRVPAHTVPEHYVNANAVRFGPLAYQALDDDDLPF